MYLMWFIKAYVSLCILCGSLKLMCPHVVKNLLPAKASLRNFIPLKFAKLYIFLIMFITHSQKINTRR
jgi:hypothetical protein